MDEKLQALKERRHRVYEQMETCSVLFAFSGERKHMAADEFYPFCVDSNFYYLTGIDRADCVLVMIKTAQFTQDYLYLRHQSMRDAVGLFEDRSAVEYRELTGVSSVLYEEDFYDDLMMRMGVFGLRKVYLAGTTPAGAVTVTPESRFVRTLRDACPAIVVEDFAPVVKKLRRIKSDYEVSLIRRAIELTAAGLREAAVGIRPGVYEFQLAADFEHGCRYAGCDGFGFDSIVAAGAHAALPHYSRKGGCCRDGELVLFDCGAMKDKYTADISRVFPVNGRFTEEQRFYYELVLRAQQMCIDELRPGMRISEWCAAANQMVAEVLIEKGLVKDMYEMMNPLKSPNWAGILSCSHEVGLNAHDNLGTPVEDGDCFVPGMVYTVEPGVYLKDLNLGIRVEDMVLITESGHEVLSRAIPKAPDEIETLMRTAAAGD